MGSHWDQLKSATGITGLISLYAVASLLVVLLSRSLGLGVTEQIVIIALILLTWPFAILISYYRNKREQRKQEQESVAAAGSAPRKQNGRSESPTRTYDELTRGTEEAVQWLRSTKLGLRSTKLGAVKSGDPVYGLPWFLVAGPAASGKTALLLSAGLDFHALPSQRRADQNLIRPTRDCEWRVTDWAVLLDTSGRYQAEGPDRDEWSGLIETIKKYREKRPLDGLLITASAARILNSGESEIEQQAKIMRDRLDELIARAQARFPVYLVFTHADLIEGFEEFFRTLDAGERAQIWGATIPLDQSPKAHALFDVEFDYLCDALMRQRLLRLSTKESPGEQLSVFDFPLRFGEARRKLGLFTSALFRPSPFKENPLLRGFYFTSSTADGSAPRFSPAAENDGADEILVAGDSYFAEHLFKQVLLGDKDLAASFQTGQENPNLRRNILLGAAAAFLLFITVGLVVSFAGNSSLISKARKLGRSVSENTRANSGKALTKDDPSARQQLEELDKLREVLVMLDKQGRDWPPLYINSLFCRFGLYSGNALNPYLRAIYFEAINQRFFKSTIARLESELKSFTPATATGDNATRDSAQSKDEYYDLLKAYLMLSEKYDKAEQAFLSQQLEKYWREQSPEGLEAVSKLQLDFYTSQTGEDDAPHVEPDDETVKKARSDLAAYPPSYRYYKRITTVIDIKVSPVKLVTILLDNRGGLEGSRDVRGVFTLNGYEQMRDAIRKAPSKVREEDWVIGNIAKDQTINLVSLEKDLEKKYSGDYIKEWREFLEGIKINPFSDKADAVAKLKILGRENSPILVLMDEVARQTNISGGGGSWWWPFGSKSVKIGDNQIARDFEPVTKFVSNESGQKRSAYISVLAQLGKALDVASDQEAQKDALKKAEADIKPLLDGFKTAPSEPAKVTERVLMQPLEALDAMISGDKRAQIEIEWSGKLRESSRNLERPFPFDDSGEVIVNDLARFLNPSDGELTLFVQKKLKDFFDEEWRPRAGASGFSPEFVSYLGNARRLQQALFPQGAMQPGFSCVITLQPATNPDTYLEINGQLISRNSPSMTVSWSVQQGAKGARILRRGSDEPLRTFDGGWWLFKMFIEGSPNKGSDNQYALGWGSVSVKLQPPSATDDPFELNQSRKLKLFREFRAPEHTR